MAYRGGGGHFNANIDPDLLRSIEAAARSYAGPYDISLESGFRPGDKRQHGHGNALDFALWDRKSGAKVPWYQNPAGATAYQQFANQWYGSLTPEEQAKARWGGYFGDPTKPGYGTHYGEQDWMHLDFGGGEGLGMLGGSWKGGFKPEAMAALGLSGAGGNDTMVGGSGGDNLDPHAQWMQGLWQYAQAASAKTGVDPRLIMAQAALETGYGKSAPNNNYFGIKGPGASNKTLEFVNGKMTPTQADFRTYQSPEEAFSDYANVLMGGRYADTRSAQGLAAQAQALGKSGYATDPDYGSKVLQIAQGIPEGGYGSGGGSSDPTGGMAGNVQVPIKQPEDRRKKALAKMADALGSMGQPTPWKMPQVDPQPGAARVDQPATPMFDPQQQAQRQQLAQVMLARLNQGSLV